MDKIKSKRILFIVVVLAQLIFLAGMIGGKAYTLSNGEKILLKTAPVDPRSLFSGDYIMLNYDISNIPLKSVDTDMDFSRFGGEYSRDKEFEAREQLRKVYVKLKKKDGEKFWSAVSVTRKKPAVAAGEVVIVGHDGNYVFWNEGPQVHLNYGIESYYIAEGTGSEFEGRMRDGNVETYIEASVDKYGNAGIVSILQDGKRIF